MRVAVKDEYVLGFRDDYPYEEGARAVFWVTLRWGKTLHMCSHGCLRYVGVCKAARAQWTTLCTTAQLLADTAVGTCKRQVGPKGPLPRVPNSSPRAPRMHLYFSAPHHAAQGCTTDNYSLPANTDIVSSRAVGRKSDSQLCFLPA